MRRRRYRREPLSIGDRIQRLVSRAGPGSDTGISRLRTAWPDVAGADVARASTPQRRSRAGVLTIACIDGGWAQELSSRHDQLIDGLRRATPEITLTRLRFAVSTGALPVADDATTRESRTVRKPTADDLSRARALVEGVDDPDLRAALERAAAHAQPPREYE